MKSRAKLGLTLATLALAAPIAAGCGDDSGDETTAEASAAQLEGVKTYLTDHSADLVEQVDALQADADEYYALAKSVNFDYEKLLEEHGDEVEEILNDSKDVFVVANPAYEEMEGIVAGVPRLAHYDVDIDAGSDASTPEDAVSFSLTTPSGKQLKQPGNLFFLTETSLYGTNPDLQAKGTEPDVDGDGKVEFGEGLPDADIYKATLDEFAEQAKSLDEDAQEFEPTPSDALTSIVIMTPTMSEYFEAWKNSRFIAGDDADELGFVATSRLSDIADILGGILVTYKEHGADDRRREPAAGQADPEGTGKPGRVRLRPPRPRGRRREIHRQAGRRARRPGSVPGRGDRRPGDAGGEAARNRTAGRLGPCGPPPRYSSRRRPCSAPLPRPRPPSPPGRPPTRSAPTSPRRRPSCSSTKAGAARCAARKRPCAGRSAPGLKASAPAELAEIERALAAIPAGGRRA